MNRYLQRGCSAIVTGAASGFGKGLADALVERGLKVLYTDINAAAVEAAATATGAAWQMLDVTDAAAVARCIDAFAARYGKLDLIINNAGFAVAGEARDTSPADFRQIVEVNLMGVVNGALPAYQRMVAQGGGHVVNIASLAGLVPFPLCASYAMTKAGVVNFSHSLCCEGAALGVQVSVVCPSFIDTSIFDNARYVKQDKSALTSMLVFPMMRLDQAVRATLAGIERQQATIIFPFHARLLWRLTRLWHQVPNFLTNLMLRKLRERAPDATSK